MAYKAGAEHNSASTRRQAASEDRVHQIENGVETLLIPRKLLDVLKSHGIRPPTPSLREAADELAQVVLIQLERAANIRQIRNGPTFVRRVKFAEFPPHFRVISICDRSTIKAAGSFTNVP